MNELLQEILGPGTLSQAGTFHHSRAFRYVTDSGKRYFIKNFELTYLSGLTPAERETEVARLQYLISNYYRRVRSIGVNVPKFHALHRIDRDSMWLIEISSDHGTNAIHLLRQATPETAARIIRGILSQVVKALEIKDIGLDPAPGNLVQTDDHQSEMTFVDFLPAHFRDDDGTWYTGYPPVQEEPWVGFLREKYFSPFGPLRILRFNLMRINPEFEEIFYTVAAELVPFWSEAQKRFRTLPECAFQQFLAEGNTQAAVESVESLSHLEIDSAREIMYRLIPRDPERLSRLFELSHNDFRLPDAERAANYHCFNQELVGLVRAVLDSGS